MDGRRDSNVGSPVVGCDSIVITDEQICIFHNLLIIKVLDHVRDNIVVV